MIKVLKGKGKLLEGGDEDSIVKILLAIERLCIRMNSVID